MSMCDATPDLGGRVMGTGHVCPTLPFLPGDHAVSPGCLSLGPIGIVALREFIFLELQRMACK